MNNREVALEFLRCFCAGDVSGLTSILAEELRFRGPLYHFESREAFLNSLRDDPPQKCGYRILNITDGPDSISVYYDYLKPDGSITIAQLFGFKDGRISDILLVFDARGFA